MAAIIPKTANADIWLILSKLFICTLGTLSGVNAKPDIINMQTAKNTLKILSSKHCSTSDYNELYISKEVN